MNCISKKQHLKFWYLKVWELYQQIEVPQPQVHPKQKKGIPILIKHLQLSAQRLLHLQECKKQTLFVLI